MVVEVEEVAAAEVVVVEAEVAVPAGDHHKGLDADHHEEIAHHGVVHGLQLAEIAVAAAQIAHIKFFFLSTLLIELEYDKCRAES